MIIPIGRCSPTAWLAALTLFAACRPGEGQRCVCEGECRRGLVCAQNGRHLEKNECLPADERNPGTCIDEDLGEEAGGETTIDEPTIRHDLGGKRDFEPGTPPTDDDGTTEPATTSAGTTGATTTTATGGTSSSGSSSGGSSSSGTSSSGSSTSGESSTSASGSSGSP